VLLVEDHNVNREVAQAMLETLGCTDVALAFNGQEALEQVQKAHYDLILMDCQMPILDGFEATRAIRALEGENSKCRIVAMTANAMHGDREKCLEAGMDDYVSKPLTLERLREVILKPFGGSKGRAGGTFDDHKSHPPVRMSIPVLDEARALKATSGNVGRFMRILNLFRDDTPADMDLLESATMSSDFVTAERHAHSLKGAAANLGAERFREMAHQIEIAAKASNQRQMLALLPALRYEFKQLEEMVQTLEKS
jgi:CheY-like chemotaxis protein